MKTIIALPNHNYFLWQVLVQINNFRKYGMEDNLIYVVGRLKDKKNTVLNNFINSKELKCKFYVYDDERGGVTYPSTLRPHILKKFFKENRWLENETIFYTDPDVIFTKQINFDKFLNDNIWYVSDTKSYISSKYIKSKSESLFHEMCKIVNVDPKIISENDEAAGGAQYIMKNVNYEFWLKVEEDSENLYKHMNNTSKKYSPEHPIQKWTADMWAVLWNAFFFNNNVIIHDDLDFCWATDTIKKWDECNIFHNAGATSDRKDLFLKTKYQKSPFNENLNFEKKYCTYNYVNEIKETKNNFKNLVF